MDRKPAFTSALAAALLLGSGAACSKSPATPPAPANAPAPAPSPAPVVVAPEAPLALGSTMPAGDVEMESVDGRRVTLAGVAGPKGTLVLFTCNHCPYAKAWEERATALGNEFLGQGVGVVAVNPNDPSIKPEDGLEGMKERAAKLGMRFPYVVDATSNVARAHGATKTPEAYLFDASGRLVYHGAIDDNANDPGAVRAPFLRDALTALVEGRPIATAETKAVGCSIKFRPAA